MWNNKIGVSVNMMMPWKSNVYEKILIILVIAFIAVLVDSSIIHSRIASDMLYIFAASVIIAIIFWIFIDFTEHKKKLQDFLEEDRQVLAIRELDSLEYITPSSRVCNAIYSNTPENQSYILSHTTNEVREKYLRKYFLEILKLDTEYLCEDTLEIIQEIKKDYPTLKLLSNDPISNDEFKIAIKDIKTKNINFKEIKKIDLTKLGRDQFDQLKEIYPILINYLDDSSLNYKERILKKLYNNSFTPRKEKDEEK